MRKNEEICGKLGEIGEKWGKIVNNGKKQGKRGKMGKKIKKGKMEKNKEKYRKI